MPYPSIGTKLFWTVQIVLVGSKPVWLVPSHFGRVQIRFLFTNFYNLDLSKMIWTWPKQIGHVQNDGYSTTMIWMVQNHFGPIEGQGINDVHYICMSFTLSVCTWFSKSLVHKLDFLTWLLSISDLIITACTLWQ